jgi:hypothetical protein
MREGRQPLTAEIKTLAKGPSTYDPLENAICANGTAGVDMKDITKEPLKAAPVHTSAATKKNSLEMCVQMNAAMLGQHVGEQASECMSIARPAR